MFLLIIVILLAFTGNLWILVHTITAAIGITIALLEFACKLVITAMVLLVALFWYICKKLKS
ncbi:hypothetical protein [Kosakonia phage Kc283]|uniref:Uncharacterized protein n=1 Tax=Kosakonia phage Kc283 TaxID=2863195 RepID=A0AAE7WF34_9CAUD|nr:hypothetical protein PP755_gp80 [Kosakonia phage Kc283]QYN79893.1 hypothetical protein [Kosakonia phage Kc283]